MSRRERYPAGVPCWVETMQPDPQAALDFYRPLFGWDVEGPGPMPGDPPGRYFVASVGGRDVAGISSLPAGATPAWNTYVRVDRVAVAVARATAAGGRVLAGPLDALPAGRLAVLADPSGASFCLWEAGTREGAQLVNEPRAWAMSMLHARDLEGSARFYGALFGSKAEPVGNGDAPLTMFRLPGYVGGEPQQPVPRDVVAVMAPLDEGSQLAPHWSVDFWTDDARAVAEHAVRLGGTVVVPPYRTPLFEQAVLADASGATFSVSRLAARPG